MTIAQRVADEMDVQLGQQVGYNIRHVFQIQTSQNFDHKNIKFSWISGISLKTL